MFNIPRVESTIWLGAGKMYDFHPTILYAASQLVRMTSQIVSRFRLPEILRQVGVRQSGVDTGYLLLNFRSNQVNQFTNLFAVEIPRVRQRHRNLPAHHARMRVQNNDTIRQSNRLTDGVSDKQNRLPCSAPDILQLLVK